MNACLMTSTDRCGDCIADTSHEDNKMSSRGMKRKKRKWYHNEMKSFPQTQHCFSQTSSNPIKVRLWSPLARVMRKVGLHQVRKLRIDVERIRNLRDPRDLLVLWSLPELLP